MDRLDKLINNRRAVYTLILWILLLAAGCAVSWFGSARIADSVISQQNNAVIAAVGGAKFGSIPDEQDISAGLDILGQFGVTKNISPRYSAQWEPLRNSLFSIGMVLLCSLNTLWFAAAIHSLFSTYDDIEDVRRSCIDIAEDLSKRCALSGSPDSCEHRLAESVNTIAVRVEHLNSELDKSHREVKDFLTDFSHQLKTYLAVIRLNSDMLTELDNISPDRRQLLTDEIQSGLDAMEELVRESLKLARLDAGAVEYNMIQAPIADTCGLALQRLEPLLRQKNISASADIPSDAVMLQDKLWLCEAIENIIKNSADHSGCSAVSLSLKSQHGLVTLIIEDNGMGIPQSSIPGLFRRFSRKSGSTGLTCIGVGMSIAYKIIRAHSGEIMVYSDQDKGTRFELCFMTQGT